MSPSIRWSPQVGSGDGFGVGDPKPSGTQSSTGVLEGGRKGPMPFLRREQTWGPAPAAPKADVLTLEASNLASVTVDMRRARLESTDLLDARPEDAHASEPAAHARQGMEIPADRLNSLHDELNRPPGETPQRAHL